MSIKPNLLSLEKRWFCGTPRGQMKLRETEPGWKEAWLLSSFLSLSYSLSLFLYFTHRELLIFLPRTHLWHFLFPTFLCRSLSPSLSLSLSFYLSFFHLFYCLSTSQSFSLRFGTAPSAPPSH